MMTARAHKEVRDLDAARKALLPLINATKPTVRVCLLMAEIEEAAGAEGSVREWLSRAAKAPRDKTWVAGKYVVDRWAPASPDGTLDAFSWRVPEEDGLAEPSLPVSQTRPEVAHTPPLSQFMIRAPDDPGSDRGDIDER